MAPREARTVIMRLVTTSSRMAFSLASITLSAVLTAALLGMIPDRDRAVVEGRRRFCETTAISFTLLAELGTYESVQLGLEAIASRDTTLRSAAVRLEDGEVVAQFGEHDRLWNNLPSKEL